MSKLPYEACQKLVEQSLKIDHLSKLLNEKSRNQKFIVQKDNYIFDFSHEKINDETIKNFENLVDQSKLFEKIEAMFKGEKINKTENRAVLHVALRSQKEEVFIVDGKNVTEDVHQVLSQIQQFSSKVRNGEHVGYGQQKLKNLVVIGIGGSYLSIEFVFEALRCQYREDRVLRFLANVDPIDFYKATQGLCPSETLFLVCSKTFTTAETMLNARTAKQWILNYYKQKGDFDEKKVIDAHMCACSTNLQETTKFGITNVFGFWDWVGGRFSVSSAIGILPLSIHFGFETMQQFLKGMNQIDKEFRSEKNILKNTPLMLGLIGFYNSSILNFSSRAILPYCQALAKFAPHIQQLDMESNGKRVSINGDVLEYSTGVVNFGEPGTNGQHSFYQMLHQGRIVPCEFIGYCKTQNPIHNENEIVSNHDELMSNFFSQPDALAIGRYSDDPHRHFPGDRPSLSFLFDSLDAYSCGQLLAIYEHRTTTEGFLWQINSFDQFGVELGKVLANNVRMIFVENKVDDLEKYGLNTATQSLIQKYIQKK